MFINSHNFNFDIYILRVKKILGLLGGEAGKVSYSYRQHIGSCFWDLQCSIHFY